jgi:hypothetical protein
MAPSFSLNVLATKKNLQLFLASVHDFSFDYPEIRCCKLISRAHYCKKNKYKTVIEKTCKILVDMLVKCHSVRAGEEEES